MKNILCKYCGKQMRISHIEYDETWYECSCDGYKTEQRLKSEINELKCKLSKKEYELEVHKNNSLCARSIMELKKQIREIENKYRE